MSRGVLHPLRLRRLGIDTYLEPVVYMRSDCHVCRAEGFEARSRVKITLGARHIVATLNVVHRDLLAIDEAALSEFAWKALEAHEGDAISVTHADPVAQAIEEILPALNQRPKEKLCKQKT